MREFLNDRVLIRANRWLSRAYGSIARRRPLAILVVVLFTFMLHSLTGLWVGIPAPAVHDEFSYLLAGDTFAHGRLTNPTHPMWFHFESFHIIHQPTYASKYPPMQGLFLALGQAFTGYPIVGVWLSMAVAAASLCWMLQAWLSPRWALLGGLLFATHTSIFWQWGQSYWGGVAAVIGGTLLYGSLHRLVSRAPGDRKWPAILLVLGLAVLANSRPFEGLLVSLPAALILVAWGVRRENRRLAWDVLKPVILLGCGVALAMGYYHYRVTGRPWLLPYQSHAAIYSVAPNFLWLSPASTPEYHTAALREYHTGWEMAAYQRGQGWDNWLRECGRKLFLLWEFYFGVLWSLPLLALLCILGDRWMRLALGTCLFVLAGMMLATFGAPHYAAPLTGLLFALVLQCLRAIWLWRHRGYRPGRVLVAAFVVMACFFFAQSFRPHLQHHPYAWPRHREAIKEALAQDGRRHLILVEYGQRHSIHCEWVYNEADIDNATVVWARRPADAELGPLLDYFRDRRVWVLEVEDDERRPRLWLYRWISPITAWPPKSDWKRHRAGSAAQDRQTSSSHNDVGEPFRNPPAGSRGETP